MPLTNLKNCDLLIHINKLNLDKNYKMEPNQTPLLRMKMENIRLETRKHYFEKFLSIRRNPANAKPISLITGATIMAVDEAAHIQVFFSYNLMKDNIKNSKLLAK